MSAHRSDHAPAPATALEAYRELRRENLRQKDVSKPRKQRKSLAKIDVASVDVAEVEAADTVSTRAPAFAARSVLRASETMTMRAKLAQSLKLVP